MTDPNAPAAFAPTRIAENVYAVGRAYVVGDLVIHGGVLYHCTVPHRALEALDLGKFAAVSAALQLTESPAGSRFYVIGA